MELYISRLDNVFIADINGTPIDGIVDYKVTTSAHNGTEVELKIKIDDSFTELKSSTN